MISGSGVVSLKRKVTPEPHILDCVYKYTEEYLLSDLKSSLQYQPLTKYLISLNTSTTSIWQQQQKKNKIIY